MKIGIIYPYDITKGSGVGEIVRAQAQALRQRGHTVYVITPRLTRNSDWPEEHTIFVGGLTDLRSPAYTTVQVSAGQSDHIEEMLEAYDFDILHFHEPWLPMLSIQILSRSKTVNVATFHAKLENPMIRTIAKASGPYMRSVIKHIHSFVATGQPAAEYIRTLTRQHINIIPVDIDLNKYVRPAEFDDARPSKTILYVGRLEGRKGVRYLLYALAMLQERHPKVALNILGQGADRSKLERLVQDLGLKNVRFLGYRETDEKIKRYQSSDLFCSPALFGEGFGMVLLEAMATGLPTVAGDNPGYEGVMKGLGAMSLVNPKDTPEFARRLELMLFEPELRNLWRKWAKTEVQQYRTEKIAQQYEEVYRTALEKHRKKR